MDRAFSFLAILVTLLEVGTRCLAGTTGIMNGYVRDAHGKPSADVRIEVVSPSKTAIRYTNKRCKQRTIHIA